MNFSKLLSSRQSILRQAHLANLAFSYFTICRLADRAAKAGLTHRVKLRATNVGEEIVPASLIALSGNQSVIEEHFSDEDVLQLADSIEFAMEGPFAEVEFNFDDLVTAYAISLRVALERNGVALDEPTEMQDNAPPQRRDE
jgi:hypothetical protein